MFSDAQTTITAIFVVSEPAVEPPAQAGGFTGVQRHAGRTGGFTAGSEVPPVGPPVSGGVLCCVVSGVGLGKG